MRSTICFNLSSAFRFAAIGCLAVGVVGAAHGQYTSSDPTFPPAGISFETKDYVDFGSTAISINGASISGFVGSQEYSSLTVNETFDNPNVTFATDIGGTPITLSGDLTFEITSVPGTPLGQYNFDITNFAVSGGGYSLALDPTQLSLDTGTSIIGNTGTTGLYSVNPTFTLYTELNGTPASAGTNGNGSLHFSDLAPAPEPFTMGLGIAGIGMFLRRRMKAKA